MHCVWKTAIPFSVPGAPRWPAGGAGGACCERAPPTQTVMPIKNARAMIKVECLVIHRLLKPRSGAYGNEYTYNDSFLVGSGSVMPTPPDPAIAPYCLPFVS